MKLQVPDYIASVIPYEQGMPIEDLQDQRGLSDVIKMASNENPWGASPKVVRALRSILTNQHRYPDGTGVRLRNCIAEKVGLLSDEVVLGNGSSELIDLLVKVFVNNGDEVISSNPSFLLYGKFVQAKGGENFFVPLKNFSHDLESIQACISEKTKLIFLDNPNNPTGSAINPGEFYTFLSEVPETAIVAIDEAYIEYMDNEFQVDIFSLIRNTSSRCGVVVLRTFSKIYGLAGLRIGYGLMPKEVAEYLNRVRQPFNINQMATAAAIAALGDEDYRNKILQLTLEGRQYLHFELEKVGVHVYPSQANFLMVDVHGDAMNLYEALLQQGVIVRPMVNQGFPRVIRVSVGTEKENQRFIEIFSTFVKSLGYVG